MSTETELKAKETDAKNLEQQIAATDARIAALTVESKAKRTAAQDAYIAAHKARFSDINPAMALIGAVAAHEVKLFGAGYFLSPPNGEQARQIDVFVQAPVIEVPATDGKTVRDDLGPVHPNEATLLQWLSAIQPPVEVANGQKRDISKYPIAQKLKMIRTLPVQLINRLAEECEILNTYLSVVMERELGN